MGADASHLVGKTVLLRNDHGKYLQYDGHRFNHSTNTAAWEQWQLEAADRDGDRVTSVYIHNAAHDIRISASDNKRDLSGSKNRAGWEKWQLVAAGDRWYIKSAHGTYLNQGSDGNFLQSRSTGGSELFAITIFGAPSLPHSPSGRFYLTNVGHNTQVSFGGDHNLSLSPNKAGWEQVRLEEAGGKAIIAGCHGRNLQVDGERVQTSPNKGGWEQFTLTPTGSGSSYYVVAHTGNHLGYDGRELYCRNKNTGSWEQWVFTAA
jgi:hypothetical protein